MWDSWGKTQGILPLVLLLLLGSSAGVANGVIVEASAVSNVVVTASKWDLRGEADGGCGVAGCDPRLTRDGYDNTEADSRWSCEPSLAGDSTNCKLYFELDSLYSFTISHLVMYLHESDDDTKIAISFMVYSCTSISSTYCLEVYSGVTSPGTALGKGEKINVSASTSRDVIALWFDLTNQQWIDISEVEIFLDVTDPDDVVIPTLETTSVVRANTVTNVMVMATNWDLQTDAGCGDAGCDPRLTRDGKNNSVAASRWSCTVTDEFVSGYSDTPTPCNLFFFLDDQYTFSYMVIYVHESDDLSKRAVQSDVYICGFEVMLDRCEIDDTPMNSYETVPGTALGTGQRVNLPRPEGWGIAIVPDITAEQWIDISEVEIYLEVTETNVFVAAAKAWTYVIAETLTTVTIAASASVDGFGPGNTRDGDDNTVASSRWSCEPSLDDDVDYCELYFAFNDRYTVSHLVIYVHESDDATKTPVSLEVLSCSYYKDFYCSPSAIVGTYVTEPGTALGEGERVNLIRPTVSEITLHFPNITAGQYVNISEVEIYFEVPDSTPTPAPFVSFSDTDTTGTDTSFWLSSDTDATGTDTSRVSSSDTDTPAPSGTTIDDGDNVDDISSSASSSTHGVENDDVNYFSSSVGDPDAATGDDSASSSPDVVATGGGTEAAKHPRAVFMRAMTVGAICSVIAATM